MRELSDWCCAGLGMGFSQCIVVIANVTAFHAAHVRRACRGCTASELLNERQDGLGSMSRDWQTWRRIALCIVALDVCGSAACYPLLQSTGSLRLDTARTLSCVSQALRSRPGLHVRKHSPPARGLDCIPHSLRASRTRGFASAFPTTLKRHKTRNRNRHSATRRKTCT